jgi:hypothetical protein
MRRTRKPRRTYAALALALLGASSGCYGSFAVTRDVYHRNQHIEGRAARDGVFVALLIAPVYEIALLADLIVFNTWELITGDNPILDGSAADDST